jgi:hypothetical protein
MKMQHKTLMWLGSMLLAMGTVGLAGCSGLSAVSTATPTATPSAATILANAVAVQETQIKDVEFSVNMNLTSNGTAISGNLSGTETASPNRTDLVVTNLTAAGAQFSGEIITDTASNAVYLKFTSSSIPEIPIGEWIKTSGASSLNPLPINPTQVSNLSQLTGATLKGSEVLDGIKVWHLQAAKTINGSTAQVDVYIRQDNNQLYEVVANLTGTSATTLAGTITLKITGVNTGATISLPTPSLVLSQ